MRKLSQPYIFDWNKIQFEDSFHIEYSITDICNKNCISCSHLAPLAKRPNFVSIEEFTNITRIMRKLMPDTHTFWLTGGEPTLHPDFVKLLKISSEVFDCSYVGIYSNGLTLKNYVKDKYFWDIMKDNGIVWAITNYEIDQHYFESLFDEHGCRNNLAIIQNGKYFFKLTNYSYDQPISQEKYDKCGWEKSKINIRNGNIYNCPSAEFADLFNDYFGESLKVCNKDYLTVDERLTRQHTDDFRGPIPFCSQCDLSKRYTSFFKNIPSNKNKNEWSNF